MSYTELSVIGLPGRQHSFSPKISAISPISPTIRQQLVTAVKAQLQAILVSGGYNFDLGDNVFEWRTTPLEPADLPAIVFRDVAEVTNSEESGDYHINSLNFVAEIKASEGATTPKDIRNMIGDVYKAIGVDVTWSDLAVTTESAEDGIEIEQNENIVGGATIQFSIVYGSPTWDPYTAK